MDALYKPLIGRDDAASRALAILLTFVDACARGMIGLLAGLLAGAASLPLFFSGSEPEELRSVIILSASLGFAAAALRRIINVSDLVDSIRNPRGRRHRKGPSCLTGMLFPFLLCAWLALFVGFPEIVLAGVAVESALAILFTRGAAAGG